MADAPPKAQANAKKPRKHVKRDFDEIVRQADEKALKLFDLINDQTRNQIQFAILLHRTLVILAMLVLFISIGIVFYPTADSYLQTFSLIGTPASLVTLIIASLRNPVTQQNQALERVLRLNVIFLNFVHRVQNSKLLIEQTMEKIDEQDLAKLYSQMDNFENIGEEALEALKNS